MSINVYESTAYGTRLVEYPNAGCEFCHDCGDEHPISELYLVRRYDSVHREMSDYMLCWPCAPHCNYTAKGEAPCLEVAMPESEGGWCEFHDAIAEQEIAREEGETSCR